MATPIPKNQAVFSIAEILAATAGTLSVRGPFERATSISTNTREMAPGAAFIALRGPTHDGHAYLEAAAAAGAAVAVVERDVDAPEGMTVVRVDSTLRALADLARAHVQKWRAMGDRTLIGITGSAGKTTTRVATAALVESLFPGELIATRGNLNNRIGVPMMLFSLDSAHRICVVELGTSEPGEIAELCRMAQPDVGILTLIAAAHLDGLGSIDGVEAEKAALFHALSPGGIAVANGDDARVRRLLGATSATRRVTFGRDSMADVRVVERAPIGMTRSRVVVARAGQPQGDGAPTLRAGQPLGDGVPTLRQSLEDGVPTLRQPQGDGVLVEGQTTTFETPLVGEAGALACAAAIAAVEAAFHVRLDGDRLTEAFDRVDVREGAQRLVPLELSSGLSVIDDTYNANPTSMAASIRAASEMAIVMNRRLVLVLGEMRELGKEAVAGHEAVGRVAAESGARLVVAVGGGEAHRIAEEARAGVRDILFAPSVDEGLPAILEAVDASDFVLVKASRSVGTDRIVAALERAHGHRRGSQDRS